MPTVLVQSLSPNEKDLTFEVKSGKILFDELDHQGLKLPHGCLAGSCGSCRIEILEGAQNLAEPGAVERDTIESIRNEPNHPERLNKLIRLSCRSRVMGNIKIKILK